MTLTNLGKSMPDEMGEFIKKYLLPKKVAKKDLS